MYSKAEWNQNLPSAREMWRSALPAEPPSSPQLPAARKDPAARSLSATRRPLRTRPSSKQGTRCTCSKPVRFKTVPEVAEMVEMLALCTAYLTVQKLCSQAPIVPGAILRSGGPISRLRKTKQTHPRRGEFGVQSALLHRPLRPVDPAAGSPATRASGGPRTVEAETWQSPALGRPCRRRRRGSDCCWPSTARRRLESLRWPAQGRGPGQGCRHADRAGAPVCRDVDPRPRL